jgi:diguanylate cyclase (GGDEF)-like protein/PAS domain S-box-containing protein
MPQNHLPNQTIYQTLFEHSLLGMIVFNEEGVIIECNDCFVHIVGSSYEKLIGLNMLTKLPDERIRNAVKSALQGVHSTVYGDYTSLTGGKTSYIYGLFFVEYDSHKRFKNGIALIHDLTDLYLTKERLNKTSILMENIVRHLPEIVWAKDKQGMFIATNKRLEALFGYQEADILGKSDYDFFDKEIADFFRKNDQNAIESDTPLSNEEWLTFADGHKELCETVKFAMRDENKQPIGVIGIARDITKRRALEDQLLLTQFSIDHANVSIYWVDAITGDIFFVNKAACEGLGYSFEELTQLRIVHIDALFDEAVWEEHAKHLQGQSSSHFETIHQRKDGTTFPVEIFASILSYNDRAYNVAFAIDISERKALEKKLHMSQHSMDQATLGIFWVNEEGFITYANQSACLSLGYTTDEITHYRIADIDVFMNEKLWHAQWERLKAMRVSYFESLHRKKSGEVYPVDIYINFIVTDDTEIIVGFVEDISKRKAAKIALEESEKLLKESQEIAKIGSWQLDLNSNSLVWSDEVFRIFELDQKSFPASYEAFLNVIHPEDRARVDAAYMKALQTKQPYEMVHKLLVNGRTKYVHERAKTEYASDGRPMRSIGTVRDITDEQELASKIEYLVNHDDLTGLPNRLLFTRKLEQHLLDARKNPKKAFAILFIDLDNFKYINDGYGHSVGDVILKEVASRLSQWAQNEGLLARFGADEFVLLYDSFKHTSDVAILADALLESFKKPFVVEEEIHLMSASVGISLYPEDAKGAEDLIKFADAAMHRAKESGKNHYQFYTNTLSEQMLHKMKIINYLRDAISQEQFELYYQPQISLQSNKIVGFEALVRWHHPLLGFVSPVEFIPAAEESKLIIPLGEWILHEACGQMVKWKKEALFDGVMAVNVSGIQLDNGNFSQTVKTILDKTRLPAENLELEVTESSLMKNPQQWIEELNSLDALGVKLAIDDFGTGYSSLSYLRQMPVDILKVDQSFVRDLPDDSDACVIAEAVIGLGRSMRMESLAEGIETEEQLAFLKASGCQTGQGYYFSRPMNAANAEAFLRSWRQ